jgi:hypothetical protein
MTPEELWRFQLTLFEFADIKLRSGQNMKSFDQSIKIIVHDKL